MSDITPNFTEDLDVKQFKSLYCVWSLTRNYDDTMYETECEETFIFLDGNPYANNFRFCPYCGKEIVTDDADEIETDYYTSEDPDGAPEI